MTAPGQGDGEEDQLLYRASVGDWLEGQTWPGWSLSSAHKAATVPKAPAGCERSRLSLQTDENERKTL